MTAKTSFNITAVLHGATKPLAINTIVSDAGTTRENVVELVVLLHRYGLAEKKKGWYLTEAGKTAFQNRMQGVVE